MCMCVKGSVGVQYNAPNGVCGATQGAFVLIGQGVTGKPPQPPTPPPPPHTHTHACTHTLTPAPVLPNGCVRVAHCNVAADRNIPVPALTLTYWTMQLQSCNPPLLLLHALRFGCLLLNRAVV